jgi:hypothetical protein
MWTELITVITLDMKEVLNALLVIIDKLSQVVQFSDQLLLFIINDRGLFLILNFLVIILVTVFFELCF